MVTEQNVIIGAAEWHHVSRRGPSLSLWHQPELCCLSSRIPRWIPQHVTPAAQVDGNCASSPPLFSSFLHRTIKKRRGLFSSEVRKPHVAAFVCLSYNMEKCFRRGGRERKRPLSLYLGSDAFHPKNSHNFSIAGNAARRAHCDLSSVGKWLRSLHIWDTQHPSFFKIHRRARDISSPVCRRCNFFL